ncbi:MAG: hypothetical protein K2K37_10710, partial [Muribaculaceae bacterium]|nr:hypothetical protein [Muribaculaceae bacterium]
VIGATVFGNSGVIKGLTGNDGKIIVEATELPVVIQCIGYEQTIVSSTDDTIKLSPRAYELKEVETPADRPIKRVLCFASEYSSGLVGKDTMQYYCEYMAQAYISTGKVKGYRNYDAKPQIMTSKRYARIAKIDIDSVFRPQRDDDITELSWFDFLAFLPNEKTEAPDAIKKGCETDTVKGKYGPKFIYRKKNGLFTMTCDYLSEHKDRIWSPLFFKLLGLTTDITMGSWTFSFADNGANTFGLPEFLSGTYNIHLTAKGKWIKKAFGTKDPIEMDSYLEIYPVEITNMTVDEYKEARDAYPSTPFNYPDGIQPLSPAIQALIERIDIVA